MKTKAVCSLNLIASLTLALAASADEHWDFIDESFEEFEPGMLWNQSGEENWGQFIDPLNSSNVLIERPDPGDPEAIPVPDGDQFLRILRPEGHPAGRMLRNPRTRTFPQDGRITWLMRNNSADARGTVNVRIPVNAGTSNLFQFQVMGEVGGEFSEGNIRYHQSLVWRHPGVAIPRETWTLWELEYFTADSENRHLNLRVTTYPDGDELLHREELELSGPIHPSYDGVESIYGFDIAAVDPDSERTGLPFDFAFDLMRTEVFLAAGFPAWQAEHFTADELEAPEISGPAADPGGFGIPNLLRYALGLDARNPDPRGLPVARLGGIDGETATYFTLSYNRILEAPDAEFQVLASNDLQEWESLGPEYTIEVVDTDDTRTVTVRDSGPVAERERRFLRLAVELVD